MPFSIESKLNHFREQGYVKLGRLINLHTLYDMKRRADAIMMGIVKHREFKYQRIYEGDYERRGLQETKGHKGDTFNYRKITGLEHDSVFKYLVMNPYIYDVIQPLFEGSVSVYRAVIINKPVGSKEYLPWHQDNPTAQRWDLNSTKAYFIWTPLDNATIDSGCLHVIPQSHKRGTWGKDHFPTEEEIEDYHFEKNKVSLEMSAGESVLVNNLTMHKSDINITDKPRRAFSCCYISSKVQNTNTWKTYPEVIRGHHESHYRNTVS